MVFQLETKLKSYSRDDDEYGPPGYSDSPKRAKWFHHILQNQTLRIIFLIFLMAILVPCLVYAFLYSKRCQTAVENKDVEMVSCKDAASRKGIHLKNLCNNGTCEDIGNSHKCHCYLGYIGSYCQEEINECDSSPCQNAGKCIDKIGTYLCECRKGIQGQNCELNIDDCRPNPCQNGGTCHDLVNNFMCSCPTGILGIICDINVSWVI